MPRKNASKTRSTRHPRSLEPKEGDPCGHRRYAHDWDHENGQPDVSDFAVHNVAYYLPCHILKTWTKHPLRWPAAFGLAVSQKERNNASRDKRIYDDTMMVYTELY